MVVPRFDLPVGGPQLVTVLRRIVAGRAAGQPSALRHFEGEFAQWLGASHALFLPSARTGLYLILDGLKRIGRIDADRRLVIIPAWTHASVPMVVRAAGFIPYFVDCNPHTLNADADGVPSAVWPHAAAAVVTHLYGTPADTRAWRLSCAQHKVAMVEDCAQALGATASDGVRCGAIGDAAYFSFQLTKNFTTLGGGMVATSDPALAEAMRGRVGERPSQGDAALFKQAAKGLAFLLATRPAIFTLSVYPALRLGWKLTGRDLLHDAFEEQIHFSAPSGEVRAPSGVQADLGRAQLPLLDRANERRRAIGFELHRLLGGSSGITLPQWPQDSQPIFMSFVLRVRRRMAFMRELLRRGVDTSPGYLRACHHMPSRALDGTFSPVPQLECPQALRLEHEQVHLPVYPRLSEAAVEAVARAAHAAAEVVHADLEPDPEPIMIGGGHW